MTTIYDPFSPWGEFCSVDDVAREFRTDLPDDIQILAAIYTYADYDGTAFVLYRSGGKLWEVNGGHCSCYGLEDQWSPEEVEIRELVKRPEYFCGHTYDTTGREINDWIHRVVINLPEAA